MIYFSLTHTGHHMLGVSSIACLKPNLLTVPTTQYTTKDKCNISIAKNMTNFSPMYFYLEHFS